MNEVFDKKEEVNLNEAMKRRALAMLFVSIITGIDCFVRVYAYGGFSKIINDYPSLVTLNYVVLVGITYVVIMFVLNKFSESNKVIRRIHFVLILPFALFLYLIFIPFKRYVRPYLLPIFVYIMLFAAVFFLTFFSFVIFDENIGNHLPLIMYLIITVYAILISYTSNLIFKHYIQEHKFIEFKEGESKKERIQNDYLYEYGFNNSRKEYVIAMRYFHQNNAKIIIYIFYFAIVLISSIMTFGGFVEGSFFVENLFKVLLASLVTYICFERIVKHKNLFDVSGKNLENNTVSEK